jgi:hypothetical protein
MRKFVSGLVLLNIGLLAGLFVRDADARQFGRTDDIWNPRYLLASRNSSGTMSQINGPYISGTTISSSIINARFGDIETELTDSLSRSGKGGMTAALKGVDGTVAAPAFSFTSEPGTGLYRIGATDLGFAINGVKKLELTSALFTVTPAATFTGILTASTAVRGADGAVGTPEYSFTNDATSGLYRAGVSDIRMAIAGVDLWRWGSNFVSVLTSGQHLRFDGSTYSGFGGIWLGSTGADTPSTTNYALLGNATVTALNTPTGGTVQFNVQDVTKASVTGSGFTIGASGTAIGAVKKGTFSWNPGGPATGTCGASTTAAFANAALGDVCWIAPPAALPSSSTFLTCYVNAAGSVTVNACNLSGVGQTFTNGTYTVWTLQTTN